MIWSILIISIGSRPGTGTNSTDSGSAPPVIAEAIVSRVQRPASNVHKHSEKSVRVRLCQYIDAFPETMKNYE